MDKALWIGPRHSAREFKTVAATAGLELLEFETVEAALAATTGMSVAVAVIAADWGDATPTIKKLVATLPAVVVLAATRLGVPLQVGLAVAAGAVNILDLQGGEAGDVTKALGEALARHRRRLREREMLLRLRSLNEEFLRNMVNLEQKNIQLEERLASEGEETEGPGRVLVVDDEAVICEVICSVLEQAAFEHASAETGRVALTMLRTQPFDVVITDKNLPDMTGLDILRETKKLRPDTAVIVITGYASKEAAIEALNLGADAFFEKPFDLETVSTTVDKVIKARRERAQKQRYLSVIKQRNREFLEQYKAIRQDIEAALAHRAVRLPGKGES